MVIMKMVNENRYLFVFKQNLVILCERLSASCHFDKESCVFLLSLKSDHKLTMA